MKNNNLKFGFFIFILLVFVIGGFVLMKKSEKLRNEIKSGVTEIKNEDIRKDNTKEYIYFTDYNLVVNELDIEYKTININFEDPNGIENALNKENNEMSKSLVYDENNDDAPYDHLTYAKYAKYEVYYFNNYISLVVNEYSYDYESLVKFTGSKTYVFAKDSGKLFSNDELFVLFNINKEDIKGKLTDYLNDQNLVNKDNPIDVDKTIESNPNYQLYVDKLGRLVISILVNAEKNNYNDVIVLS